MLSLVRQSSGGKNYDHSFGVRQTGRGPYADVLAGRFQAACRRNKIAAPRYPDTLDCTRFEKPGHEQLGFDFRSRYMTQRV